MKLDVERCTRAHSMQLNAEHQVLATAVYRFIPLSGLGGGARSPPTKARLRGDGVDAKALGDGWGDQPEERIA